MTWQIFMPVCISAEISWWQGYKDTNAGKWTCFSQTEYTVHTYWQHNWLLTTNHHSPTAPPTLEDLLWHFQTLKGLRKRLINSFLGYYCGGFEGCLYRAQTEPLLDYAVLTLLMMKNSTVGFKPKLKNLI